MRCTACNEIVHPSISIQTSDKAWCDIECLRDTTADLKPLAGAALAADLVYVDDMGRGNRYRVLSEIGILLDFAKLYHHQRRKHLRDAPDTLRLELEREIAAARRPTPPPPKESQR